MWSLGSLSEFHPSMDEAKRTTYAVAAVMLGVQS